MAPRAALGWRLLLLLAFLLGGCDVDTPAAAALDPLEVGRVLVTTGYDARGRPIRTPLDPLATLQGVSPTTSVAIDLTRFLLPASGGRQAICLRPSTAPVTKLADCTAPSQPFLLPDYRPSGRQITYYQQPGGRLAPGTLYRLTIFPPSPTDDFGFRAFDGAPLALIYQLDFVTSTLEPEATETGPSAERYCEALRCVRDCEEQARSQGAAAACVTESCRCLDEPCFAGGDLASEEGGLFATSCSGARCHGVGVQPQAEPWGGGDVAMGLDLSAPEAIEATAVGRVARQSQVGEHAGKPELSPKRFGRSMPIISPAAPSLSYLTYKAIVQLLNHPPAHQLDDGFLAELGRLRESAIGGLGMPPGDSLVGIEADPTGKRAWERLRLLEAWIAHGAVTKCP